MYLLTAFGHQPLEAKDGAEGLSVMRRERPDLVLVDIHMPVMDGYEFARQVRADADFHAVPLVAVTALAMTGDREKILAHQFDGYIAKPVAPETLLAEIRKHLEPDPQDPAVAPKPEGRAASCAEAAPDTRTQDFAPQPSGPAAAAVALQPEPQRPFVLFVDNSETNVRVVRASLEPSGYRVGVARSAEEGITEARRRKPDLIISDVHMPRQDGFEFLKRIMADPELSQVPFMVLTSSLLPDRDRQMALLRGAKRFLSRPIETEQLLAEVEACLSKKKGRTA